MSFPYNSADIGNRIFKPIQNDAVERLRVSNPQSLIDTDFEYGLQSTKWETLELMNNIPSFYSKTDDNILPAEALVGLSANFSTSFISVSTVPADVSAWPDPQPTDTGNAALPNGWNHWIRNSYYGSSYSGATVAPFVMPFQINTGNGFTDIIYAQGSGAFSIGNISGGYNFSTPYDYNYLCCTGCVTGSVVVLSAGNTSSMFNYNVDGNRYDESPVNKFAGTSLVYDKWASTRVLTIINDGRVGGGGEFCDYQYPYHTTMKRAYYKRLDTDTASDRMVFYVFTAGPGPTFWSGTTFNRTNQSLNWGKEPSRVVWEVYRYQPIIKVTTVRGCSGLDSWSEQTNGPTGAKNGPLINRGMFTQFGVVNGDDVLYNEGFNSTANNLLVGSAKIVNYSAVVPSGGATLRVDNSLYTTILSAGEPIVLDGTLENRLDGTALVVNASYGAPYNQYNVIPRNRIQTTSLPATQNYITSTTSVYRGAFYSNASIPFTSITPTVGTTTVTVTTPTPHNMFLNQPFFVVDPTKSDFATFPWIGAFKVYSIPSSTSFTYQVQGSIFVESVFTNIAATKIYLRPEGIARHRFTDGGVQITPANNAPFSQIIRQTRNYFRYQSGKSILFSTGLLLKPSYDVESFTVNTQPYFNNIEPFITLSIKTEQPHGFATSIPFLAGPTVRTRDFTVKSGNNRYNGTFIVDSVADEYNFTVKMPVSSSFTNLYASSAYALPGDLTPGGNPKIDVVGFNDAIVQSGMFDEQNGIFFRYEKNKLSVARRTSTLNLAGTIAVTAESSIVDGTNTKFSSQLQVGDYIVIRGMSFVVSSILSNTRITISPKYSGITSNGIKITKTVDTVVSQDNFNLDKLDGTGPSGYAIDLNKMQMIYFDYSWYGAGRIRWGVRVTNGDIVYCHEMLNNNVNTEAYMRSGNLPARFEIINKPQQGTITRSSGTRVSVTNTVSPSAILVNIVKSATPQGPFSNFIPPLTSFVVPYQNVLDNTAFLFNLDNNGTNSGAVKQPPVPPFTIYLRSGATYSNFSKFGIGSASFDGLPGVNGGYTYSPKPSLGFVSYPQYIPNSWTAGDFSIECFVYFRSFQSNDSFAGTCPDPMIFGNNSQYYYLSSQNYGFNVRAVASVGPATRIRTSLNANQYTNYVDAFTSSTNVLTLSTWHHVVWQRKDYVTKVFVDGVPVISTPDNTLYNFSYYTYVPVFGACQGLGGGMIGYMDEIRGVFQAAPYPVDGFVPPTQPLAIAADYQQFAPVINRDILNLENNYYTAYTIPTVTFPYKRELLSTQTVTTTATTLTVSPSSTFFIPNTGTILIGQEYINYSKIGTKSTGDQVIQLINRNIAGLTYIPEHSLMQGGVASNNRVLSINNNCAPALSHWGVSVIMDGEFTEDKSYLFTASMSGFVTPSLSSFDYPLISIRLAPAADYGVGSVVGLRNLINRSIIILNDVQIVTRQAANITVKINGDSPLWSQTSKWQAAGNGSLAQYMDHSTNTGSISGGVTVLGFLAGEQDAGRNQVTDQDINIIRNLGNSILGGNKAFPDGPDILTVYARPFTSNSTNRTLAKISWLEAQG
jgi:hypothetical protein